MNYCAKLPKIKDLYRYEGALTWNPILSFWVELVGGGECDRGDGGGLTVRVSV